MVFIYLLTIIPAYIINLVDVININRLYNILYNLIFNYLNSIIITVISILA